MRLFQEKNSIEKLLEQDRKALDHISNNMVSNNFFKPAVMVLSWTATAVLVGYWIIRLMNPKINPEYSYQGEHAWPAGHSNFVDKDHYDCALAGGSRELHKLGSLPTFSCKSPDHTCCDIDNHMTIGQEIAMPIIVIICICFSSAITAVVGIPWNGSDESDDTFDEDKSRDSLCTAIRDDVINKFKALPLAARPVADTVIDELEAKVTIFENGQVETADLHRIRQLISSINSGMEQTKRPLSQFIAGNLPRGSELNLVASYSSIS